MPDFVGLAFPWARGGGDPKTKLLRFGLRLLPLRRRLKIGNSVAVNASRSGVSVSLMLFKGLTILLQPGKPPLMTMTIPGSGHTYRYRLPGPRLAKLSLGAFLADLEVERYRKVAELTTDRLFPGLDPPAISILPLRVRQIARFDPDENAIVVSRAALKRLGPTATESAVRREAVRAGVWERHGVIDDHDLIFQEELARAGEQQSSKKGRW